MGQVDLAVHRDIPVRGAVTLQLRVEAFNLFNQISFGLPANASAAAFSASLRAPLASSLGTGGVAGGGFSPLYQVGGPRSIQLALRLQFDKVNACGGTRLPISIHGNLVGHRSGRVPSRGRARPRVGHQPVRAHDVENRRRTLQRSHLVDGADDDGFLWLGTEFGVVRFDGVRAGLAGHWRTVSRATGVAAWLASRDELCGSARPADWRHGVTVGCGSLPELAGTIGGALRRIVKALYGPAIYGNPGRLCAVRGERRSLLQRRGVRAHALAAVRRSSRQLWPVRWPACGA